MKRILFAILTVAMLVCLFAVGASAAAWDENRTTIEYTDANGNTQYAFMSASGRMYMDNKSSDDTGNRLRHYINLVLENGTEYETYNNRFFSCFKRMYKAEKNGQPIYQYNDEVTKLTATPLAGGQTIELNPDIYYALYSRMTYTRYKGEHGLDDAALDALIADGAVSCVLRLEMELSDDAINYWEFYPISANRVMVRVKNGKYASAGARFYIYGTALSDITNAYLHLMKGEPFDFEQRYE